jgi:hypothetical protein
MKMTNFVADDPRKPVSGFVSGVNIAAGVRLSARQWRFLEALRQAVPASVPLTVTSGLRDIMEQVNVMRRKLEANDLAGTYGAKIEAELKNAPFDQWPAIIASMYDRKLLDPGQHTGGGAVDLRTQGLSHDQLGLLLAGVRALGAKSILEATPAPHLHVFNLPA